MGTSLIGKAVGFGSKEYGFESRVSNMMRYNSMAYVVNHVNLTTSRKEGKTTMLLTRKTYPLIKVLHQVGCIHKFLITRKTTKGVTNRYVTLSAFFYKSTPFFKGLRLVSTPSKRHTVSLRALRIIDNYLYASTMILSTPKGFMHHRDALRRGTGGLIVCMLS